MTGSSTLPSSVHPYIPNSLPDARAEMLEVLGMSDISELYAVIPQELRCDFSTLELPKAHSEPSLHRYFDSVLENNTGTEEVVSFLGGGCARHYVPALCDEINQRAEFLTSYVGQFYTDHGKLQAFFEYESMVGSLVGLDVVSLPTYDWGSALGTALRMASRITGRNRVVIAGSVGPERLAVARNYCRPDIDICVAAWDRTSGRLDLRAVESSLSVDTAAVYFENPSYFGTIDDQGQDLADLIHSMQGLLLVGVDPISLGVLSPPAAYGADIICGDLQPLGMHMHFGGGLAGFVATRDEERFVMEHPSMLIGLTGTDVVGELGFGYIRPERTIFAKREEGIDFTGTSTGLWAITAAVYLASLGPEGLREVGQEILDRAHYFSRRASTIPGVEAPALTGPFFKEVVVQFDESFPPVDTINDMLLERSYFGGHSLTAEYPELGNSALYCITELHERKTIDEFVDTLGEILTSSVSDDSSFVRRPESESRQTE